MKLGGLFWMLLIPFFTFYDTCFGIVNKDYGEIHDRLRTMIFSNTSHHMPKGNPTIAKVKIQIAQIVDLNTAEQVMTVVLGMYYTWESGISWDPNEYNGIEETFLGKHEIWTPILFGSNSVDSMGVPDVILSDIKCFYDGWCEQEIGARISFSCGLNLEYFPRDEQHCSLMLTSLAYTMKQIVFEPTVTAVDGDTYEGFSHPELTIKNASVSNYITPWGVHRSYSERLQIILLNIDTTRDPSYIISTLIMPMTLVGLITAFGFLLPSDGDIKLNVQLMSLLTQAVYMSILSEKLSPTLKQPRLVLNIGMLMTLSAVGTLLALLTYNLINKAEYGPPRIVLKVFRIVGLVLLCGNIQTESQQVSVETNEKKVFNLTINADSDLTKIGADVKLIASQIKDAERQQTVTKAWTYMALVIDRIFFVLVIVGVVIIGEVLY